eukprot:257756-Amphidinium_carterae.1
MLNLWLCHNFCLSHAGSTLARLLPRQTTRQCPRGEPWTTPARIDNRNPPRHGDSHFVVFMCLLELLSSPSLKGRPELQT